MVLAVASFMVWFGLRNSILDLGSYRMPSMIPLTVYTSVVPVSGALIVLFCIEQMVNGCRDGYEGPEDPTCSVASRWNELGGHPGPDGWACSWASATLGVPVAFALIAGVLVATAFTPVSFASMIGQMFHGIDSETLLAVPFFLLVGELMSSANVIYRMIALAQTLVGPPARRARAGGHAVQHVLRRRSRARRRPTSRC